MGIQSPTQGAETGSVDPQTMQPPGGRQRLDAIDLLRGIVMVLMALDHTRDYFSTTLFDPTDLAQTNTPLFLTRWVTHFCAPVFVFLAGTGAFLYGARGKTRPELAWFLLSRGLWLVFLEFTLVQLGWSFQLFPGTYLAQVIAAIGASMVVLAGLVFLPTWAVAGIGVLLIAGHNALGGLLPDTVARSPWLVGLLFLGPVPPPPAPTFVFIAYPLLPWLGVMAAGYGLGPVWLLDRGRRRRWLVGLGSALLLLFVVLRAANGYGDPRPWSHQATEWFTVLSFVNCTKYPPSLLFVLMTLGPALLALAWFDRPPGRWGRWFIIFGRVPLFYYLLHVPVIHGLALLFAWLQYREVGFLLHHPAGSIPDHAPPGYGLPGVYFVWYLAVWLLYPACRWFADVKARRRYEWLSYL
jgi:uncharacterized membrane protein